MAEGNRMYDLVVFGATGFTGKFVVEELARTANNERLTWAIAGRNMKRLQDVLSSASKTTGVDLEDVPIIIADVASEGTLNEMCQQSKVVLNCVGPYVYYGEAVVRACIENGTSHLDISGEPMFLEKMQLLYNKKASDNGSYVIGACGFDSVPCDMGVCFTQQAFKGKLSSIEGFLSIEAGPQGGAAHYATWESAVNGFGNIKETIAQRKKLLPRLEKPKYGLKKRGMYWYSDDAKSWCITFPGSDRSVVNRTQRAIHDSNGNSVQFNAFLKMPSLFSTILLMFFGGIFGLLAGFKCGRYILKKFPKLFSYGMFSHEGPTREQMKDTSFTYTFHGIGHSEEETDASPIKKIKTKVVGPEPGYIATPIALVQCGYALLKETNKLPGKGGVLTPGTAFANTQLIERLNKNNIKFTIE